MRLLHHRLGSEKRPKVSDADIEFKVSKLRAVLAAAYEDYADGSRPGATPSAIERRFAGEMEDEIGVCLTFDGKGGITWKRN